MMKALMDNIFSDCGLDVNDYMENVKLDTMCEFILETVSSSFFDPAVTEGGGTLISRGSEVRSFEKGRKLVPPPALLAKRLFLMADACF